MAKNFAELEAKMTPDARAESDRRTQQMLTEILENELKESGARFELIEPDAAAFFSDRNAVNEALRRVMKEMQQAA